MTRSSASDTRRISYFIGTVAILGGVASGIVTSTVLARRTAIPQTDRHISRSTPSPEVQQLTDEVRRLQRTLANTQAPTSASHFGNSTQVSGVSGGDPRVATSWSSGNSAVSEEQAFQNRIAEHARDPIDRAWASQSAQALQIDITSMSARAGGCHVVDVDCRTSSCVATIEWPNFRAARDNYQRFTQQAFHVNCAREMTLIPPQDDSRPFQASIFFDCANARVAQAQGSR